MHLCVGSKNATRLKLNITAGTGLWSRIQVRSFEQSDPFEDVPPSSSGVEKFDKLVGAHVQELLEIHPSVGELPESSLLGNISIRHDA